MTIAGKTYDLDPPFFVLATQNPIEQEGTYPLPEAQLDRFMFDDAHPQAKEFLSWGAGPRAAQYLILGSKARAALDGRPTPSIDDVRAVALPVLRHRLVTNFHAEAEGVTTDDLIRELVAAAGD